MVFSPMHLQDLLRLPLPDGVILAFKFRMLVQEYKLLPRDLQRPRSNTLFSSHIISRAFDW